MTEITAIGFSKLLIDEPPLQVLPSLAVAIGLNEALFLQQVHYWLGRSDNIRDNRVWVYKTAQEWQAENFPFWSLSTIWRTIAKLEKRGLLISTDQYNQMPTDRTKWYTIAYVAVDALCHSDNAELVNLTTSRDSQPDEVLPETTTKTTDIEKHKKSKKTPKSKPAQPDKITHTHPALQAYREVALRYPHKSWYGEVAEIVGDDPGILQAFKNHVRWWVGKGYNPTNVKGVLETFQERLPALSYSLEGRDTVRIVQSEPEPVEQPDASPEAINVWKTTHEELSRSMDVQTFDTWLRPARLLRVSEDNGQATYAIGVQNERALEILNHKLGKVVLRVLGSVARMPVDVVFEVISRKE